MRIRYSVTYEFDTRPSMCHTGYVDASSASTAVARAIRIAQKTLKPVKWSSMVCVVLERHESES